MEAQTETASEEAPQERPEKSQGDDGGSTGGFGAERWVHLGFLAAGLVLVWLLDRITVLVWDRFAEPIAWVSLLGSAVIAAVVVLTVYRNPTVHRLAFEVSGELAKVSWPTREETWVATIVVIITSLVAAAILGTFDVIVSGASDWIYRI